MVVADRNFLIKCARPFASDITVFELKRPTCSGWLDNVVRAKKPKRLPVILSREEVKAVLNGLSGAKRIMAHLLYGSGLRLMECLRLRVKDVDFSYNHIVVREGERRQGSGDDVAS